MRLLRTLLALCLLAQLPAAAECVMIVRMDEDPPYLTMLPDGRAGGVNADVAREALKRIGCRADFHALPFTRALKGLEDGTLDILPDLFRTPEREVYTRYSRTSNRVPNRLFVRAADKERWTIGSFQDLPRLGIKLGIEAGALVSPNFEQVQADPKFRAIVTPVRTHESLWRMLSAERIDAVILDEQSARWELTHFGYAGTIVGTDFIAAAAPAYFGFSRANVREEQVHDFDQAVEDMRHDGTLAAIQANYGLEAAAAIDIPD